MEGNGREETVNKIVDIKKSSYAGKEKGIGVFVMAKKPVKQLSPERKELTDEFDIKSAKDIEDMFKDMFSPMRQEILE